jgi:hypothetical protein
VVNEKWKNTVGIRFKSTSNCMQFNNTTQNMKTRSPRGIDRKK